MTPVGWHQRKTTVVFNGPAGPETPIDVLVDLLRSKKLRVAKNSIEHCDFGVYVFSGDFDRPSHPFRIRTSDPEVIVRLLCAMMDNRQRADYVLDARRRIAEALEHQLLLRASGHEAAAKLAEEAWVKCRPAFAGDISGLPLPAALAEAIGLLAPRPSATATPTLQSCA